MYPKGSRLNLATRYTFWCHDKETGNVFDMGVSAPYAETKACRNDVAKVNPERYEYGPPQIAGTPAPDFQARSKMLARRASMPTVQEKTAPATPPPAVSCCLPWCEVPAVDHDAARTERCLDYAIKREAINTRMRDFRDRLSRFSRPGSIDSEIEWASEKTGKELNALEDQWRSLDPDRVGASS